MATVEGSDSGVISVSSHETALCLIPPRELWPSVDRLRILYDKAYGKWPPHINVIYPFVHPDTLPRALELIPTALQSWREEAGKAGLHVSLDAADVFPHRHDNTLFRYDSDTERTYQLDELRRSILKALGHGTRGYRMHMSVGQSERADSGSHKLLLNKVRLMPSIQWDIDQLYILVRERTPAVTGSASNQMKVWATINLSTGSVTRHEPPQGLYEPGEADKLQTRTPYYFDEETEWWQPFSPSDLDQSGEPPPRSLVVSSYNVLGEFLWPPSQTRYPAIVKNILSAQASADVLVLQEVTDGFLSYLLDDDDIRELYPFTSHGPPNQTDIEPLPSRLNIVVLSKWPFGWEWVPLNQKHKGCVLAKFNHIGKREGDKVLPTVLAAVHLKSGVTDPAVASKRADVKSILACLSRLYPGHPWILAGDFNLTTSSHTIDAAVKAKAISPESAYVLTNFEQIFADAELVDAWAVSRSEVGDDDAGSDGDKQGQDIVQLQLAEGEQGATYDPTVNEVAASIVGAGYNMRPQRYDRVLVRGEGVLSVMGFNRFGFLKESTGTDAEDAQPMYASDHWGVRCTMRVGSGETERLSDEIGRLVVPVRLEPAPPALSGAKCVQDCLAELDLIPSETEIGKRSSVFDTLKRVLLEPPTGEQSNRPSYHKLRASVIIVPVGSYGLGVWTSSSDIDCLCIGPFSTKTFFSLASQRLKKAGSEGVKILRKVKASTGTMLELEIHGIKVDLQYCGATSIAENWPRSLNLPPSDPIWSLPVQTLSKLKAIRDLDYLRRSIPDMAKFCIAHRFIRAWAQSRGIFSARFGYLGGMQISILLARVFKLLARDSPPGTVSIPDLLTTFFVHYSTFDWAASLVFDPFFHRQRLPYHRTAREPLAILGFFPPALNTTPAASLPSVRILAEEFSRAHFLLSSSTTWTAFLCASPTGPADFLASYKSYIRIDLHYWGASPTGAARLAGWLESRCVMLLVDLQRRLPSIHARIWPERFVEAADTDAGTDTDSEEDPGKGREYQGHYLIGLDRATADAAKPQADAEAEVRTVLRRFEEQIRGDERYFDSRTSWVGVDIVAGAGMVMGPSGRRLIVDDKTKWGGYYTGEGEDEEDDDEEEMEDDEDYDGGHGGTAGDEEGAFTRGEDFSHEQQKKMRKNAKQKNASKHTSTSSAGNGTGAKLRTATDVLNRLRWDPALDSADFVVGYEDRFAGEREKPLEAWRTEQTDEEFIPQHRILYFRRRSDGVRVWERRTRKDAVFGSGVQ